MEPTGIIVDFLQKAITDRDGGGLRALADYQRLYPGYEELVAAEYALLLEDGDPSPAGCAAADPVAAFEGAWRVDRASARVRPLSEYLRLFPGDDAGVAARHAELQEEAPEPGIATAGAGAPRVLDRYRVVEEIGRGGQGVVYRAEDTQLGRSVALKVLHGTASPDALKRFLREAEVTSRMDDPGICSVHEAGVADGLPYIAMRLVPGRTLAELIRLGRERPDDAAARVSRFVALVEKVARSVHRAHEAGVLHRDLKPGNVMVTGDGDPVILDFGLAAVESDELSITRTGDVQGTLPYMSPEQVSGASRPDRRADVYALGAVLYEALTLRRPFEAPTREALVRAIARDEPRRVRVVEPALPRDVAAVVETAMAKEPARRYATALDLAEDLRRAGAGEPVSVRPASAPERALRWARRRPAQAALVLAAVLGLPLLGGVTGLYVANLPAVEAQAALEREQAFERLLVSGYGRLGEGSAPVAQAAFERALEEQPGRLEAVVGLGIAFLYQQRADATLALVEAHARTRPRSRALQELRLTALSRQGVDVTSEEADLREPTDPVDHFLQAAIELHRAHTGDDQAAFRRAYGRIQTAVLGSERPSALFYFDLAHAAGHLGEAHLAVPVSDALLRHWPELPRARYWAGFALLEVDAERAAVLLEESVRGDPTHKDALKRLAQVSGKLGRHERAAEVLRRLIGLAPDEAFGHSALAYALRQLGRHEEALVHLERALELDPRDRTPLLDVGLCLVRLGRRAEAERAYRRYLEHDPDDAGAHADLGSALGRQGRVAEAVEELRRAVELDPALVRAHRMLAHALRVQGDEEAARAAGEAAVEAARREVELAPRDPAAHLQLADVLQHAGRLEEARTSYEAALELGDADARAWFGLGRTCRRLGDQERSVAAYRRAVEHDPEHAEAWCNLGLGLMDLARYREARDALRRGHRLGNARGSSWTYPSADWLAEAEEGARLEERLERIAAGEEPLPDARADLPGLLRVAGEKGAHEVRLRLFTHVLAEPETGDPAWLPAAAETALQAAAAADAERARGLRHRALAWLERALDEAGRAGVRRSRHVARELAERLDGEPWTAVRGPALDALPEPERTRWSTLWSRLR